MDPTRTPKTEKQIAAPPKAPGLSSRPPRALEDIPIDRLAVDPRNRAIDETSESFATLVESVRLFGVLQRLHVRQEGEAYQLIDGERRWRAARRVGLPTLPCEIWPSTATRADVLAAGIVLNDQREAHSCIHIGRRLRDIRNGDGLTVDQLARQLGMKLDRVKAYLGLFDASEYLLTFLGTHDIPLWVAAEFVRYEKKTNEARARRLAERYLEAPLSRTQLIKLRRTTEQRASTDDSAGPSTAPRDRPLFGRAFERAYQRDAQAAVAALETVLAPLGLRVVPSKPGQES